ncbi:MAG: type II toxin-antitoxin system RelE/ParE family toxin [Rhizobiales bacterium]|nr:type II toxin-antitoxin system RelE/ParE family toxin [Hyphomicrobiales bacterium]
MNVRFTQEARDDLAAILEYILRDNPRTAQQVVAAIERATDRLSQFPQSGRLGAVETTRELVVPRLPFIAVYRVTIDTVEIIAVFHAAQDRPRG